MTTIVVARPPLRQRVDSFLETSQEFERIKFWLDFLANTIGVSGGGSPIITTFLDAKGDLITATANDTPAILSVGADGEVLTVDSAQANGIKWAAATGGVTSITANNATVVIAPTTGAVLVERAALTGDVTCALASNATTLATVNASPGTFGSATQVAQVTINAKGLSTTVANVAIAIAESQVTNLVADLAAKQASDAFLNSIAALGTAADKMIYTTAIDTAAETGLTAAARTVLDDATVDAMVDTLGGASSTGTGGLVRANTPTLVTPNLGAPSAGVLASCTGLPLTTGVTGDLLFANLAQITGPAVLGVAANGSLADVAAITATASTKQVLRVSGTSIGFGTIDSTYVSDLATATATSVTAANSTLTISPNVGAVLAQLNLATANTWTNNITLGTTNRLYLLDTTSYLYATSAGNATLAAATMLTLGVAGDIKLGDGTPRLMSPVTTEKVSLGNASFRFLNCFLGGDLDIESGNIVLTEVATGLAGTIIGTSATQQLGFWGATAAVQPGATTDLGVVLSTIGLRAVGTAYIISTTGTAATGALTVTGAIIGSTTLALTGKCSKYNNITTVSGGVPSELATIDLTAVATSKVAQALYTPTAAGMFRISVVLTLTTAATTSSVLAGTAAGQQGVSVTFKTGDGSTTITQAIPLLIQAVGTAFVNTSAANVVGTTLIGHVVIYTDASAITYDIGYTSVGAPTTMKYSIHIKVEAL